MNCAASYPERAATHRGIVSLGFPLIVERNFAITLLLGKTSNWLLYTNEYFKKLMLRGLHTVHPIFFSLLLILKYSSQRMRDPREEENFSEERNSAEYQISLGLASI